MKSVRHIRVGGVEVTVWLEDELDTKGFQITIIKNYKEKGEWKTTQFLKQSDLPKALLALQKAYEYCALESNI